MDFDVDPFSSDIFHVNTPTNFWYKFKLIKILLNTWNLKNVSRKNIKPINIRHILFISITVSQDIYRFYPEELLKWIISLKQYLASLTCYLFGQQRHNKKRCVIFDKLELLFSHFHNIHI